MTGPATLLLALLLAQGHGTKGAGANKGSAGAGKRGAATTAPRTRGGGGDATAERTVERGAPAGGERGGDGAADKGKETSAGADGAAPGGKTLKTKVYNFGAMDVEGKLKTPQLLYFLNRVKLELDMSAPDKRSFMKELEKSADDKSL